MAHPHVNQGREDFSPAALPYVCEALRDRGERKETRHLLALSSETHAFSREEVPGAQVRECVGGPGARRRERGSAALASVRPSSTMEAAQVLTSSADVTLPFHSRCSRVDLSQLYFARWNALDPAESVPFPFLHLNEAAKLVLLVPENLRQFSFSLPYIGLPLSQVHENARCVFIRDPARLQNALPPIDILAPKKQRRKQGKVHLLEGEHLPRGPGL